MDNLNLDSMSLDHGFNGFHYDNMIDEDLLSIMEGACEEVAMCDYATLQSISPEVIRKAYRMTIAVAGSAGEALMLRFTECEG